MSDNSRNITHKFRELRVWQRSVEYVVNIYKLTGTFPSNERFGLTDQLRRASVSVVLNIAEGCGAGTNLEFIRFLRMAQRSAYEVIAALEIALRLKLVDQNTLNQLTAEADELCAMIYGLIKKVSNQ